MGGHWFMSAQFSITLPLVAAAISGNSARSPGSTPSTPPSRSSSAIPMPRFVERRFGARRALIGGVLLTAVGLVLHRLLARHRSACWPRSFVYSLGIVLARPTEQTVASGLVNPVALGSYFGVASLAVAFGGGLGNYAGGVLYDLGEHLGLPALPWLIFAAIGLISAAGLWWTLLGPGYRLPSPNLRADSR